MNAMIRQLQFVSLIGVGLSLFGCKVPFVAKNVTTDSGSVVPTSGKFLYIVSGTCYAGGVPTNVPSNIVVKYDILTGNRIRTIADYRNMSPGDSPVSISNLDSDSVAVSVENANARRIDDVRRDGSGASAFLFNSSAFTSVLRNIVKTSDGGFLYTRAAAVEKFTGFKTRYLNGANPYINNPTPAACAAMNTALTFSLELPNGNILISSAAATPNNKIATISSLGYTAITDCLSSKVGPTTTALPTAGVSVSSDTVLVSYASASGPDNQIVAYKYTPAASVNLGTAIAKTVVSNTSYVFGASAMAFDPETNSVYVANAPAGGERIEKFKWDETAQTLTRTGTAPFIQASDLTCVSVMYVGP
jgi:hypothetical protein